ncbi:trypsin-like serine peptidase [Staphylococcus aureus]|uniref:trypsin-like serine peptidase n=1 Tax=Staphylococcus aureus TaxID=1280 RepID=UPI00215661C9|nr:trypsin-like serine protease [Staphylococcus aureus]
MKKTFLFFILLLTIICNNQVSKAESKTDKRSLITDVFNTRNSLNSAKYEGNDNHHCTAIMITKDVGLTSSHCKDGGFEEGYIGTIYPGHSGLATLAGSASVSTFNPYSDLDIALIKTSDQTDEYSHYLKNINVSIKSVDFSKLKGKELYSIGYPIDKSGYKQYKTEGTVIETFNDKALRTTLQSTPGQSGSRVFLKENDQLIGVISEGSLDGSLVVPINSQIADWIDRIRH